MTSDTPVPGALPLSGQAERRTGILGLALAMLATVLVYLPGLFGGYVLDDLPFIAHNEDLHVSSLRLDDWLTAIFSFPSGHQGRWLGMLSFGVNHYLTGLDPFWFKATNLVVHLLNGLLLWLALRQLLRLRDHHVGSTTRRAARVVLVLVAAWMLLPINLTGVLYVVQRLEALSTTFVLLGLWLYLRARLRLARDGTGLGALWASLIGPALAGLLVKESAVLLPLYAACVELALFGTPASQPVRRRVLTLYACLMLIPFVAGLAWLSSWIGTETSYAREFSILERLLTEARVLVHYIGWTILPLPGALSLYHDGFVVSKSLFVPFSTLLSLTLLGALLAAALHQRKARPLFCIGVLWFFAAHVLTGTVIPLELVFEHRNYFASAGLLVALASLFWVEPLLSLRPRVVGALAVTLLLFYGATTLLRAHVWGDPVRFAVAEAARHPESKRAQLEFARVLVLLARDDPDSPHLVQAEDVLKRCIGIPGNDITCEAGLLMIDARRSRELDPRLWQRIIAKLQQTTSTPATATSMAMLDTCYEERRCRGSEALLGEAMEASIAHGFPHPLMLYVYSRFAARTPETLDKAVDAAKRVTEVRPDSARAWGVLIEAHLRSGNVSAAKQALARLEENDRLGRHSVAIARMASTIEQVERALEAYRRGQPGGAGGEAG